MPTGSDSLAVCIVLYESAALLDDLIAGLRSQTRQPDRLVVCLNGADDGAKARLAELAPEAQVIERPDNPGFAAGMNAAIREAACDRVLMLNPDVVLEPDHIEQLERVLDEEPSTAGVGGLLMLDEQRIDSAGFQAQPWLRIVDRGAGATGAADFREREDVIGICAAAALFRRSALEEAAEGEGEYLDPDFFMYKEDQDLCLRIRALGHDLRFEPAATARHARGWGYGDRAEVPLELRRHSLKNRYLLLAKHLSPLRQLPNLPALLVFEVILFLGLLIQEPRTLKGYLMALRLVARARARRRVLDARIRERKIARAGKRSRWQVPR